MSRFGSLGEQYFDDSGEPLSGGLIYFYESGTTTPKTTYSDAALSIANTNPVVLDAAGRQGDVFFNGLAKAVLKTSADVTVDTKDPVGESSASAGSPFADWDNAYSYDAGDIATGSDGLAYISLSSSNSGNNPTSNATNWTRIELIRYWNTNESYDSGAFVLGSDGGIYKSQTASNSGNDPTSDDGTKWKSAAQNLTTSNLVVTGSITEETYTATGAGEALTNVGKGTIWKYTLNANATFTDSLSNGQCVWLHILGGNTYSVTWPTTTWLSTGLAPTLTAEDLVLFWKVGGELFSNYAGTIV